MKLKEEEITQQLLKELFYYNPITGVFIRRKSTQPKSNKKKQARNKGYFKSR